MDKSDDSQDKYIVPGLERGLLLLCEFSRKDRTLTAPELARRLKLPRSTIFRLLTTLEAMGFVTRNGNEYRLGMAVLRLGFEYLASLELTELGQPLLNRLCDEIRYGYGLGLDRRRRAVAEPFEGLEQGVEQTEGSERHERLGKKETDGILADSPSPIVLWSAAGQPLSSSPPSIGT